MIKYKTCTKEVERPESIICDKCKKEYIYGDGWETDLEVQEFITISFVGGYASVFGDGTEVELHICQHCLIALIGDLVGESYE